MRQWGIVLAALGALLGVGSVVALYLLFLSLHGN